MIGGAWDLGIKVVGLIVILISAIVLLSIIDWRNSRRRDDDG